MGLADPYSAIYDDLSLGFSVTPAANIEGQIGLPSAGEKQGIQITLRGLPGQTPLSVDALWKGAIVARASTSLAPIESVTFNWTDEQVDDQIVRDLGSLPKEPQLEAERRMRLLARMKADAKDPSSITEDTLETVFAHLGATSAADLVMRQRAAKAVGVGTVGFAEAPPAPDSPRVLPFAAAILLRNAGFSLTQLLAETSQIKQQLARQGFEVPAESWIRKRRPFTIIWVVPAATFDDNGWPGANPTQRVTRASSWLAEQGIALISK